VRNVEESEGKSKLRQAPVDDGSRMVGASRAGQGVQQLSIALQSVMQVNPIYAPNRNSLPRMVLALVGAARSSARSGGGLLAAPRARPQTGGGVTFQRLALWVHRWQLSSGACIFRRDEFTRFERSIERGSAEHAFHRRCGPADHGVTREHFVMASSTQLYKVAAAR